MNKELLNTCSESVQFAIKYINSELDDFEQYRPRDAPVYYLLDRVGSDVAQEFVNSWTETDFSLFEMSMERPHSLVYLFKLEREYNPETWKERSEIIDIIDFIKSEQTINGRIRSNDIPHAGPLWALLQYEPNSRPTQNAINHFKSEVKSEELLSGYQGSLRLAVGSLALCEDDFNRHEQSLRSAGEQLESNMDTFIESRLDNGKYPYYHEAAYILMALSKLPEDYIQSLNRLTRKLHSEQEEDGHWPDNPFITVNAMVALGLISTGEGPRIPAHTVEWQQTLNEQARQRSRPHFVSTFPAKAGATSATGIHDRSESLITSACSELRIGSLYIDMLYEEILDLSREHPDLKMKILTRGRDISGNRQRIKKTVLDELIESTSGNVRENHRLHSRLIISDRDAMIISSADLTRDQLRDEFNAGIYTSDPSAIADTIKFFDRIWGESSRVEHS